MEHEFSYFKIIRYDVVSGLLALAGPLLLLFAALKNVTQMKPFALVVVIVTWSILAYRVKGIKQILTQGEKIKATVTKVYHIQGQLGHFEYKYSVSGVIFESDTPFHKQKQSYHVGDLILVAVAKEKPERSFFIDLYKEDDE